MARHIARRAAARRTQQLSPTMLQFSSPTITLARLLPRRSAHAPVYFFIIHCTLACCLLHASHSLPRLRGPCNAKLPACRRRCCCQPLRGASIARAKLSSPSLAPMRESFPCSWSADCRNSASVQTMCYSVSFPFCLLSCPKPFRAAPL
jgi:hypothetical protein